MKLSPLNWLFLTLAGSAALAVCGCAVSEELDPFDAGLTGTGGSSLGSPGGAAGSDPSSGSGGTTGAAGTFGFGGRGGTTGSGGTSGLGGRGGSTGTAGTTGQGGRAGAGGGGSGGRVGSGGRGGTGGGGGSTTDGGSAPTFTEIYNNILVVYCSGSNCHNPGSQKGVSFSSQANAYTAVRNRVTPGNGGGSSFYTTVNSGAMPAGAPKLSAANLALIKAWIDAGASNS
jgi:hypothetical protein